MKIIITLLFVLLNSILFGQSNNFLEGDTLKVFAVNGLNLRESPSLESSVIKKLSFGEEIVLEEITFNYDLIQDRNGFWIKVKTKKNLQGFVFSGFTTKQKMPKELDYLNSGGGCNDHILFKNWNLDILSDKEIIKEGKDVYRSKDEKRGQVIDWKVYEDGTIIKQIYMYEESYLVIETPNLDLNDILNFIDFQLRFSEKIGCKENGYSLEPKFEINGNGWFEKVLDSKNFSDFKVFKFGNRIICSIYHS